MGTDGGIDNALQLTILQVGDVSVTMLSLMLFCLLIILLVLFVYTGMRTYRTYLLNRFYCDYRIRLDRSIGIHWRRVAGSNCFRLSFPHWLYRNKDGSRDLRRSGNSIRQGRCVLDVDTYRIACESPIHLVWLVNALRAKGVSIDRCFQEEKKYQLVAERSRLVQEYETIASIREKSRGNERDFEFYCAQLYRAAGWDATVTPGSGDGGCDIELRDETGLAAIVECKCWNAEHKVGRPVIQKLFGANATFNAPRMIFVTTSDFSSEAIEYARVTGVELVNGRELLRMAQSAFMASESTRSLSDREWELNRTDLLRYYPPDYPPERFETL